MTGAGKSAATSLLVAAAALDPSCRLYLLDAKRGMELAVWAGCAEAFAMSPAEGVTVLRSVLDEVNARADEVRLRGEREGRLIRKIEKGDGQTRIVVVIDEAAEFTTTSSKEKVDRDNAAEFGNLLQSIIRLGRAPAVTVITATQQPDVQVIPTQARNNYPQRFALRVMTEAQSRVILGDGTGVNAQDISKAERGTGYLYTDGTRPRRVHTHYLSDSEIYALAQRAKKGREP